MLGMQTYGGRLFFGPYSCETTLPMLGYCKAGLGRYPVNMLCVPRSWAASPWVIERMIVSLSAIWAVFGRVWQNDSPSILVAIEPSSPRYSIGANGLGSNDSWCAMPPGMKMWITESAFAAIGA